MLAQFQLRYPTGGLISELLTIDHGKYVVRVVVQIDGVTRASGLAAADTIELAEDRARMRALAVLGIQTETHDRHLADETGLSRPRAYSGDEPLFSQKRLSLTNPGMSATDTSWLEDPSGSSLLEPTTSVTTAADVSRSWKPQVLESPAVPSVATSTAENESPPVFNKVTPISSRRSEMDREEFQSAAAWTDASDAEKKGTTATVVIDRSVEFARTEIELKRLGWTPTQGREYLLKTYNKRSRSHLTDEELLEFLQYLESQPSPTS